MSDNVFLHVYEQVSVMSLGHLPASLRLLGVTVSPFALVT